MSNARRSTPVNRRIALTPPALLVVALLAMAAVAGCNTLEGAGEDIEEVGEDIDESFED